MMILEDDLPNSTIGIFFLVPAIGFLGVHPSVAASHPRYTIAVDFPKRLQGKRSPKKNENDRFREKTKEV